MLFRASDVARFCEVDLKTVHNWVSRGRVESFRTPGRHLRFKPGPLLSFLTQFGYDVPAEVRAAVAAAQEPDAA